MADDIHSAPSCQTSRVRAHTTCWALTLHSLPVCVAPSRWLPTVLSHFSRNSLQAAPFSSPLYASPLSAWIYVLLIVVQLFIITWCNSAKYVIYTQYLLFTAIFAWFLLLHSVNVSSTNMQNSSRGPRAFHMHSSGHFPPMFYEYQTQAAIKLCKVRQPYRPVSNKHAAVVNRVSTEMREKRRSLWTYPWRGTVFIPGGPLVLVLPASWLLLFGNKNLSSWSI